MKLSKKAQLTLFVVLGLSLLITFGLLFYFKTSTAEKKEKKEVVKSTKQAMNVQPINSYMTLCLDQVAKEGLLLLGKQGGDIYDSQNGPRQDPSKSEEAHVYINTEHISGYTERFQIPYSIKINIDIPNTIIIDSLTINIEQPDGYTPSKRITTLDDPERSKWYPWQFYPYVKQPDGTQVDPADPASFPLGRIPSDPGYGITEDYLINYVNILGKKEMNPLKGKALTPEGGFPIEYALEFFISKNIDCKFDLFTDQGFNVDDLTLLEPDKKIVDVSIGWNDVSVNIVYPLEITHLQTGQKTTINEFHTTIPVRMGYIYNITNEIINNDIRNIAYDIDNEINNLKIYPGITAEIDKDIVLEESESIRCKPCDTDDNSDLPSICNRGGAQCDDTGTPGTIDCKKCNLYTFDDLIKIKDSKSKIKGEYFEFWFVRRNREPALHYITATISAPPAGTPFDTVLANTLISSTSPDDPDEDTLSTSYRIKEYLAPLTWSAPQDLPADGTIDINPNDIIQVVFSDGGLEDMQEITVGLS